MKEVSTVQYMNIAGVYVKFKNWVTMHCYKYKVSVRCEKNSFAISWNETAYVFHIAKQVMVKHLTANL